MSGERLLLSFVGNRDPLRDDDEPGPLLSLLEHRRYDGAILLCTGPDYLDRAKRVEAATRENVGPVRFEHELMELQSVVDYRELLIKLTETVERVKRRHSHRSPEYEVLLDPGTPQMQTVWFILVQREVLAATMLQGVPPHLAGGRYRVKEIDPRPLLQEGYERAEREESIAAEKAAALRSRSAQERTLAWPIVGESKALLNAIEKAVTAASYDVPVLIRGETGTGKELFARLVHDNSPRASRTFLPLNCSAIPHGLAESALFGHTRGAFTDAKEPKLGVFRSASGGTLFLDEVGDLPAEVQPKLLRVLDERQVTPVGSDRSEGVDLRFLAATNRPLEELVQEGSFRQDLLIRLTQVEIEIPPLRERKEDIPLLVDHFLREWNETYKEERTLSPELLKLLSEYSWPGNVRELEHTIRGLCATQSKRELTASLLTPTLQRYFDSRSREPGRAPFSWELPTDGMDLKAYLFQIEKHFYQQALDRSGNNKERAASLLGLNGPAFRKALRERFGED